jgi:NAD(P)-dependent dehydrogenase (short-subunit alcohol dehydrogenase family)
MPFPLTGARAVVTGAGSGLGRALVKELVTRGAHVLAADVDEKGLQETKNVSGGDLHVLGCDVSDLTQVTRLAEEAERRFGGVDLVINNAGVAVGGAVGEVPIEDWRWIVGVNLWGPIHGCHVFAPRLKRQGSGHIINVASAAGLISAPNLGPYNVTKAAVVSLSETLHGELAANGVGVTVLCPTFFPTNIAKNARAASIAPQLAFVQKLMDKSKVSADDVARIVLDAAQAGELYVIPQADGRWLWRLKRAAPERFVKMTPGVMARAARDR